MNENEGRKAVVLLSGGLDSATCLALAVEEFGAENVLALNMYYGQKHDREIKSARAVAAFYGVPYFEMDMSCTMQYSDCSLLKHSDKEIAHKSYGDQLKEKGEGGIVDTYVPFRNGLFLSAAAAFALSKGAGTIIYGAHADDAAGNAYPDCSEEFADVMGKAIWHGSGKKVVLEAPFIRRTKAEVVKEGLRLGIPYDLTWSCYEGGTEPCGQCGTCIDRAKAFEANGVSDPLLRKENI